MAAALARHEAARRGLDIGVRSGGTHCGAGEPMNAAAVTALEVLGVPSGDHKSCSAASVVGGARAVFCMAARHLAALSGTENAMLLDARGDIPDPISQPLPVYLETARIIQRCIVERFNELGLVARGWTIAIHGGAGSVKVEWTARYEEALRAALRAAVDAMQRSGSALDACEAAVRSMEDEPLFNAGRGSVMCADGSFELDASVMLSDGRAGAVCGVDHWKHPVTVARHVLRTEHVLIGKSGQLFADLPPDEVAPPHWFETEHRWSQFSPKGTVGCVARDATGNLAAASSTGGMMRKLVGRVGDTPIVGAGVWCDRRVAVACTGHGETFMRCCAAHSVAQRVELLHEPLAQAASHVIHACGVDGGLIAIDAYGNAYLPFNTPSMLRGRAASDGVFEVAVFK